MGAQVAEGLTCERVGRIGLLRLGDLLAEGAVVGGARELACLGGLSEN